MERRTFLEGGQAYLSYDSSTRLLSPLQHKLEHDKVGSVLRIQKCYFLNKGAPDMGMANFGCVFTSLYAK